MITYVIYIYYLFYKNINIEINNKYIKFVVVKCGEFCCISGNFVVKCGDFCCKIIFYNIFYFAFSH